MSLTNTQNSVVRVQSVVNNGMDLTVVMSHRNALAKRPLFDAGCRYSRITIAQRMPRRPASGAPRARLWASLVLSGSERT